MVTHSTKFLRYEYDIMFFSVITLVGCHSYMVDMGVVGKLLGVFTVHITISSSYSGKLQSNR